MHRRARSLDGTHGAVRYPASGLSGPVSHPRWLPPERSDNECLNEQVIEELTEGGHRLRRAPPGRS